MHRKNIPLYVFSVALIDINTIPIEQSWRSVIADEFSKPYFTAIQEFLIQEKQLGHVVCPLESEIFKAFTLTPFDKVRVVIIGQDPYHGEGEAHGLCFSVQDGIKLPGSLKNIFKELHTDIGILMPTKGNLAHRAEQGVFLLNSSLTVQKDMANSHRKIGWHTFTDATIKAISDHKNGIIFLLRGAFAQKKKELIDTSRHVVLETSHPSGLSVYRGFSGSKHFSKVNDILKGRGEKEIDWNIE